MSIKIHYALLPISWIYGLGVWLRNLLFDWGWLPSEKFDVPVLCVGNISVGGTGKTPHVEYLVRVLSKGYKVAVLSRGYGRSTRGFVLLTLDHTARQVGDEPCQIKQKFPKTIVAVDADRRRGIRKLQAIEPTIDIVLLDDGFQHRYVKPELSVLLTDYNRMPFLDKLIPAGLLREPYDACKERVSVFVVTKTPPKLKPIDYTIITKDLNPYAFQQVFFSYYEYAGLQPLFVQGMAFARPLDTLEAEETILLVTGIANPDILINDLSMYKARVIPLKFPDHYDFKKRDLDEITAKFNAIEGERKMIVTTEKDAVRLRSHPNLTDTIRNNTHCLPIEVKVNKREDFDKIFVDYVRKNRPNQPNSVSKQATFHNSQGV